MRMQHYAIVSLVIVPFLGSASPALDTCTSKVSTGFFDCFSQPDALYTSSTTLVDFGASTTNGTNYSTISGSGLTLDFSTPVMRLTVPGSWGTWNCPPATEAPCPQMPPTNPRNLPVLFTNQRATLTMTLTSAEAAFGFEAQPDLSDVETMTATFFDTSGMEVGSIRRDVSGNGGALLFAATSNDLFKTVVMTDSGPGGACPPNSFCDFAIANPRFSPSPATVPEPGSVLLIAGCLAGFEVLRRRPSGRKAHRS